jgi:hypothetical protein
LELKKLSECQGTKTPRLQEEKTATVGASITALIAFSPWRLGVHHLHLPAELLRQI